MSTTKSGGWWKSPRMLLRTILQLDDTPHSIALGATVGMWIGMTPTVGIQMALVMIFVFFTRPFFRFNVMAAIVMVYISNPLTMIPLYWFYYKVGTLFIEGSVTREHLTQTIKSDGAPDSWDAVLTLLTDLGWPLMLGSVIVATIFSVITYPSMLALVYWFRRTEADALRKLPTPIPEPATAEPASATSAGPTPAVYREIESKKDVGRDEKLACVAERRTVSA